MLKLFEKTVLNLSDKNMNIKFFSYNSPSPEHWQAMLKIGTVHV